MGGERQQFFHNTRHLMITGGFRISSCWRYCAHKHRFPPPKCGCVFLVCVVWRRRNAGAGAPFHTSSLTDERHDTVSHLQTNSRLGISSFISKLITFCPRYMSFKRLIICSLWMPLLIIISAPTLNKKVIKYFQLYLVLGFCKLGESNQTLT